MKTLTTKQMQRMEKKKKKIAALLEITKLNDKDREAKMHAIKEASSGDDNSSDTNASTMSIEQGSNRPLKRPHQDDLDNTHINNSEKEETVENTDESDPGINKKPRLSCDEYTKLKAELAARKKLLTSLPRFRLKIAGENASLNVNVKSDHRIPIFLTDIQHLLLYSLHGHHSPYVPARWCQLQKYNKVSHTVVFVVEGLSLYHFMAYESMFSHITEKLEHRLEVMTPAAYGGSIIEDIAAVPITGIQSDRLLKEYGSIEAAVEGTQDVIKLLRAVFPMQPAKLNVNGTEVTERLDLPATDRFPRTHLLLSLWQMVEENYPMPLKGELAKRYGDYIMTKDEYVEATSKSPMFGLDCEMCKTTSGELELTRISIVDESMNNIYDTLVMPENPITDYLTRFSGITKDMMKDVTTSLSDVQQYIRKTLPADAILVGQSLNCDLHTLQMMHPYVIDTSVIFNITGDRYRKTKLQTLVMEFLGESIQRNKAGHCSLEDSKASLKLAQLKLANSVDYGDAVLIGRCDTTQLKITGNQAELNGRQTYRAKLRKYATSLFTHVTKANKTAAIVGDEKVMNEYSKYLKASSLSVMDDANYNLDDQVRLVIADNHKQAVKRAAEIAMEHAFILCHIRIEPDELKDERVEKTFRTVDKWVNRLWQHMATNGLACVVFAGENNGANGACFLNLKRALPPNYVNRA